jgi:hypothetical protein
MICCHRTRWRQTTRHFRTASQDSRHGNATGAAAAARILFAKTSCAAAGVLELLSGGELSMAISPEVEAQILRYYHAEKWTVGTIAAQLKVHHGAVARVLALAGLPRIGQRPRPSRIDPLFGHRRIRADVMPAWPRAPGAHLTAWGVGPTAKWAKRQADAWRHAKKRASGAIAAVTVISVI